LDLQFISSGLVFALNEEISVCVRLRGGAFTVLSDVIAAYTVSAARARTVQRVIIWSRVNSPADGVAERD
jgi:hypothetical protein